MQPIVSRGRAQSRVWSQGILLSTENAGSGCEEAHLCASNFRTSVDSQQISGTISCSFFAIFNAPLVCRLQLNRLAPGKELKKAIYDFYFILRDVADVHNFQTIILRTFPLMTMLPMQQSRFSVISVYRFVVSKPLYSPLVTK